MSDRRDLFRALMGGGGSKRKVTVKRGDKEVDLLLVWPGQPEEKAKPKKKEIVL